MTTEQAIAVVVALIALLGSSGGIGAYIANLSFRRKVMAEADNISTESLKSVIAEMRSHVEWQRRERAELLQRICILESDVKRLTEENDSLRSRIACLEAMLKEKGVVLESC